MARLRAIAFPGVSAAEQRELRGLVARASELLGTPWRVADPAEADLLALDVAATEGLLAQAQAAARGALCVVIDAEDDESGLLLSRPFEIDGLMQLLVGAAEQLRAVAPAAAAATVAVPAAAPAAPRAGGVIGGALQFGFERTDIVPPSVEGISLADFLAADLVGNIPDARPDATTSGGGGLVLPPVDETLMAAIAAIPSARGVAGSSIPAARGAPGAADEPAPQPPPAMPPSAPPPASAVAEAPASPAEPESPAVVAPRAHYPLLDFLSQRLIGLPSRIVLDGAVALVIDPNAQAFHATGPVQGLDAYLDTPLARTQWTALLQSQLAQLRSQIPARPFDLLYWYQALRTAPPGLSPRLDPGALYSLKRNLPLEPDFPRAARIAEALRVPRGLGEVANVAGTSVVEVYATVGAFAAIGYLEQHARSKAAAAPAATKTAPSKRGVPPPTRR
jgi:hypothetical protein